MNKTFLKGFICGVIAMLFIYIFIKSTVNAVTKTAEYETRKSESYASEMEAERRAKEGLPK